MQAGCPFSPAPQQICQLFCKGKREASCLQFRCLYTCALTACMPASGTSSFPAFHQGTPDSFLQMHGLQSLQFEECKLCSRVQRWWSLLQEIVAACV